MLLSSTCRTIVIEGTDPQQLVESNYGTTNCLLLPLLLKATDS